MIKGNIGEKSVETAVLLLEHDIPTGDFSGEVLACLPPEGWSITEENMVGRRDLRHLPVMSIDPPGCRDIDDALHWRQLPSSDNWEVTLCPSRALWRARALKKILSRLAFTSRT